MIIHATNRWGVTRVLFAWDGRPRSVKTVEEFLSTIKNPSVHSVHLMPHESIRAYGTAVSFDCEPTAFENKLRLVFNEASRFTRFMKYSQLELIFGERVNEIVRVATLINCDVIFVPKFEQSQFSRWLHGDLNKRLVNDSPCQVVFYNSEKNKYEAAEKHKDFI